MTDFLQETFTDTDAVLLENHTSDNSKTWSIHSVLGGTVSASIKTNRFYNSSAGQGRHYYSSATPASAEYDVTISLYARSLSVVNKSLIIGGRYSTSANTGYQLFMQVINSSRIDFTLYKFNAGSPTQLGSTYSLTSVADGNSYTVKLELNDAAKKVYIDGVERISSSNNDITTAGSVVVGIPNASATAGLDVDSLTAGRAISEVAATLPMLTLATTVAVGGVGQVAATLPLFQIALGENSVRASLPALTIAISGTTGGVGQVVATLPVPTLALSSVSGEVAVFSATLPKPVLALAGNQDRIDAAFPLYASTLEGYSTVFKAVFPAYEATIAGYPGIVGTISGEFPHLSAALGGGMDRIAASFPSLTATLTGTSGVVGQIEASFPLLTSAFTGAAQNTGVIAATLPLLRSSISGRQTVIGTISARFPALKSTLSGVMGVVGSIDTTLLLLTSQFIGSPQVSGTINATFSLLTGELIAAPTALPIAKVIAVNVRNAALSEYEAFNFNSFAQFNGVQLAANTSGLHALGGDTDGASTIQARVRSGQNDLRKAGTGAADRLKRPLDAYVSYQSLADARFSILVEDTQYDYHLPSTSPVMKTQKVDLGRGLKTRYVQWQMENLDGQALEVDTVTLNVDVLKRRV